MTAFLADDPSAQLKATLEQILAAAKAAGADSADARVIFSQSGSVGVRMGRLETVERNEDAASALRVFVGQRQANVSGSDFSAASITEMAARAVAMARIAPEDRFCGLAPREEGEAATLELDDGREFTAAELEARARRVEDAARAQPFVANSGGAQAEWSRSFMAVGASDGFRGWRAASGHSMSVSAIARRDEFMERDYDAAFRRFSGDLPAPESLGSEAGRRAARRLGARKPESRRAPVMFEPRAARGLLGAFLSAMSGVSVARGASFLRERLGEKLLPASVSLTDDPTQPRGPASHSFDGEGVVTRRRQMIENGVLRHFFLNWPAARQLGMESTGHAGLGFGDPPGVQPTNVRLSAGDQSPEALMREAGEGLLVSEMFGPSFNIHTGDYSVGVAGLWFSQGEIAFPVSEITVAGNLLDIFARLVPANDLRDERAIESPTLLVPDMAIAGA